jgi:hypothetical protein
MDGKSLLAAQQKIHRRSRTVPGPVAPFGTETGCPAWAESQTSGTAMAAEKHVFTNTRRLVVDMAGLLLRCGSPGRERTWNVAIIATSARPWYLEHVTEKRCQANTSSGELCLRPFVLRKY